VQRALATRLSVDPSDIAKVVDELAAAGWVGRTRDPADRRRVRVTVTPEGRTALAALRSDAEAVQDDLLAPLDAAERDRLTALLRRVFDHLQADPDPDPDPDPGTGPDPDLDPDLDLDPKPTPA
jgi:DNA-binding MarR family transcriptional regulator